MLICNLVELTLIFPALLTLHVQLGKNKNPPHVCWVCSFWLTDCCLPVCLPALLSPSRLPGAVFDRQASIRRSLINTDTVSRRPKKVKRRKTISGLPDNINLELGMDHCGATCCPLLSTDLSQHARQASLLPFFTASNLVLYRFMLLSHITVYS